MRGVCFGALALGLSAALLVGGCGSSSKGATASGGGSSDAKPYVDAYVASAQLGDNTITKPEAECVGPKLVAAIGLDRIKKAGVSPQQLMAAKTLSAAHIDVTADGEQEIKAAFAECITAATFTALFNKAVPLKELGLTKLPTECAQALNAKSFAPVFAAAFVGGKESVASTAKTMVSSLPGACAERFLIAEAAQSITLTAAQTGLHRGTSQRW